jgi:hypothetical protein
LGPCGLAFTGLGPSYCPYDGTLYYPIDWADPATGLRLEEYGESAVEMVVAHEMAHHAQLQMQKFGIPGVESTPGTQMELEADCLAGVYANRAITQPAGIEAALAALGEAGGHGHGTSRRVRVGLQNLRPSTVPLPWQRWWRYNSGWRQRDYVANAGVLRPWQPL